MSNVIDMSSDLYISEVINIDVSERPPYYKGEYNVIPSVNQKVLETKNKSMSNDVVVLGIPMYQFDNLSDGQTVVIGGDWNGSK